MAECKEDGSSVDEKITYLKELLEHQKQLYNREEEQCAFLTSMLLRSHFKSLTEKAFYSAFRKTNVHPDDFSGKPLPVTTHDDVTKNKTTVVEEKKEDNVLQRKFPEKEISVQSTTAGSSKNKTNVAEEKKEDNFLKRKLSEKETSLQSTATSSIASGKMVKQEPNLSVDIVVKKPKLLSNNSMNNSPVIKQPVSAVQSPVVSSSLPPMKPPPAHAGEAARLLGEQLLKKMNSSSPTTKQSPEVNLRTATTASDKPLVSEEFSVSHAQLETQPHPVPPQTQPHTLLQPQSHVLLQPQPQALLLPPPHSLLPPPPHTLLQPHALLQPQASVPLQPDQHQSHPQQGNDSK